MTTKGLTINSLYEQYCKYCRKFNIKEKDIVDNWREHYYKIRKSNKGKKK